MLIEINMSDVHRSLGAGRRIVTFLGIKKGQLLCRDALGLVVRVPVGKYRFLGAVGHEAQVAEDGSVQVKVDDKWLDLADLPVDDSG